MRNQSIILCLGMLFLLCNSSNAQRLKLINTQFIGGMHRGVDLFSGFVFQTTDKGSIISGQTKDSGSADIPRSTQHPVNDSGDVILIKLDSFGNKQWVKVYGKSGIEGSKSICQTSDGGFAVLTGSSKRVQDFAFDRIDANGNYLWSSTNYGSSRAEGLAEIISTPDHGFLMAGWSMGADGDIPYNYSMPIVPFQPTDWILIKTDSLGNKQWLKILGTSGDESFGGLNVLSDGKYYYMLGSTVTKDHDCRDSLRLAVGWTGNSPYVLKLDSAGNLLWSKAYGGGLMSRALFDPRDSSIVGIGAGGNDAFEFHGSHGGPEMFMFKIDRNGKFLWGRLYGDQYDNQGKAGSIQFGPNGGYYLGGVTNALTFPPPVPYNGNDDGWLVLTDSVGNVVAQNLFGGAEQDRLVGVVPTKDGVAAIGYSDSYQFSEGTGHNYTSTGGGITIENTFVSHFQFWPVGISKPLSSQHLKVYPNPARQQFTIVLLDGASIGTLRCMDATGRLIYELQTTGNQSEFTIPTISWQPGVYSLSWQAKTTSAAITAKIIIQ